MPNTPTANTPISTEPSCGMLCVMKLAIFLLPITTGMNGATSTAAFGSRLWPKSHSIQTTRPNATSEM